MYRLNKPPTKYWFRPYGPSETVDALVDELNGLKVKLENSHYRKKNGHILINWGNRHPFDQPVDFNRPENVAVAISKMQTFRVLQAANVPIPRWTQNKADIKDWQEKVVGRDTDSGRSGRGITVYQKGDEIGDHLFYSEYFRKERELRVHVFKKEVIFVQEKLKRKGYDGAVDKYIRSHDRGWCFAFHHLAEKPAPAGVRLAAVASVAALGLDFGAVDIGWNKDAGPVVFEVNTAPGLEESSLEAYATAFRKYGE
jgi:hypothetical protein